MWGRPFAALRAKSPFLGASAAGFSPARVAKPRPRPPPFVRTQPPLRALWRRKDGKEPPPAHQPRTKSCFQPKWRREKMRFSDQASSCCSGELWSPPTPGADMLPTTSSDPEGFRSRPIAFWKALEPLSKAYISTSTLHCDLRISNGHTACGCERGYRRRRGIDGAAETDVAEAGAYGHLAPNSLTPTRKVASLMVTSLSAVASAEGQWRRMVSMGQRHMCQK